MRCLLRTLHKGLIRTSRVQRHLTPLKSFPRRESLTRKVPPPQKGWPRMSRWRALLFVAALPLCSSSAQDQPPDGPPGPPRRPPPIILALDTNHDGVIDAKEIDNAPASLRTLDKNGDGVLT